MRCPKCGNPYIVHKGIKRHYTQYKQMKDGAVSRIKRLSEWSEIGYICKKCGFESKNLKPFEKK